MGVSSKAESVADGPVKQAHDPELQGITVNSLIGWPVKDSVEWLIQQVDQLQSASSESACAEFQEVLEALRNPRLHAAAETLAELADAAPSQPGSERLDDKYKELCKLLEEAHLVLRAAPASASPADQCIDLCKALMQFSEPEDQVLQSAMQSKRSPAAAKPPANWFRPLSVPRGYCPPGRPALPWEDLVALQGISKDHDDAVQCIDELLTEARNVCVVGEWGVGKTAIVRKVLEQASPRFDQVAWLTVGGDATDLLSLLQLAFLQLVPWYEFTFESPEDARRCLVEQLAEDGSGVLLVLDDVRPDSLHAVVEGLNFVTSSECPQCDGSRLVMTVRPSNTLTGQLERWQQTLPQKPEVVKVSPLAGEAARQLFHHHAFGARDAPLPDFVPPAACAQLIADCAGIPLALHVLGSSMRHLHAAPCASAEDWEHRSAELRSQESDAKLQHGLEDGAGCLWLVQAAVHALPCSLKECFIAGAAFPEHALIPEAHLVHLFATHAPVPSPSVTEAATHKLAELVQMGLMNAEIIAGDPHFCMPAMLHQIALQLQSADDSEWLHARAARVAPHYVSAASAAVPEAVLHHQGGVKLRACIIDAAAPTSAAKPWPHMRLLRYLHICNVKGLERLLESEKMPLLQFLSVQGCTGARVLLEGILQTAHCGLVHLDLSGCAALERVPSDIGHCAQLSHLDLSGCSALREVPHEIGNCAQLAHLDLSGCSALKRVPHNISVCHQLAHLDLGGCSALKRVPVLIGLCAQLAHLDLSGCSALEEMPHQISNCRQLAHLNLSECSALRRVSWEIGNFPQLTQLDLSGCSALRRLSWEIDTFPQLAQLHLSGCSALETVPWQICRCAQLRHLNLSRCSALEEVPQKFSDCTQLVHLNLSGCSALERVPQEIGNCAQLAQLDISGCSALEHLPFASTIGACIKLTHLNASFCSHLQCIPESISGCTALSQLDLSWCTGLTHLARAIGACSQLVHLNLSFCQSMSELPESIAQCRQLTHLDVRGCTQLALFPESIESCTRLPAAQVAGLRMQVEDTMARKQATAAASGSIAPFRRDLAGWAAAESLEALEGQARAVATDLARSGQELKRGYTELLETLGSSRLYCAVQALDQLADFPQVHRFPQHPIPEHGDLLREYSSVHIPQPPLNLSPEYEKLREALSAVHAALSSTRALTHQQSSLSAAVAPVLTQEVISSAPNYMELVQSLRPFCESHLYSQLHSMLQRRQQLRTPQLHLHVPPQTTWWSRSAQPPHVPCSSRKVAADLLLKLHSPPKHRALFQHSDSLVPHVHRMLRKTRNIGIVGMPGIGKTTVARAVFEVAKNDFKGSDVWLSVGRGHEDQDWMLLCTAHRQLYPGEECTFESAQEGLQQIASRLYRERRSVLLVLDDVWHSHRDAVIGALNFATRPELKVSGSRLIVTTRQRNTLTYDPYSAHALPMDELEVVEVPPLSDQHAQELLNAEAQDALPTAFASEVLRAPETLIEVCGGNPLALLSLSNAERDTSSTGPEPESPSSFRAPPLTAQHMKDLQGDVAKATTDLIEQLEKMPVTVSREGGCDGGALQQRAEWKAFWTLPPRCGNLDPGHGGAIVEACRDSVEALPPSLKECFIDTAAFPEGAVVPEAHLLHLFATNAPLHTPSSLQAAAAKLDELVQHSLVLRSTNAQGWPVYSMHCVLHRAARWYAGANESLRTFHVLPSKARQHAMRSVSLHESATLADALSGCKDDSLQACILAHVTPGPTMDRWPMLGRLQYLRLGEDVASFIYPALSTKSIGSEMMLKFLCLSGSTGHEELLKVLLPAPQLLHLDLSCTELVKLPECIRQSTQLLHLDLSGCQGLHYLPASIRDCRKLTHIGLSECARLAELPEDLQFCQRLPRLNLSGCSHLLSLPDSIYSCSNLVHLNCSGCTGLSRLPEMLGACLPLTRLDLARCRSLKRLPATVKELTHLSHLDLSGCPSADQLDSILTACTQLTYLNLAASRSLHVLPESFGRCSRLAHLDLSHCPSLVQLPSAVSACFQLTLLTLEGAAQLQQLPNSIGRCKHLVHLDLSGCTSLAQLPPRISGCAQLTYVDLSGCQGMKQPPSGACVSTKLVHLNLNDCGDLGVLPIRACPQLTFLGLRGHRSLKELPQSICESVKLRSLDLMGCDGLEQLPEDIGACSQLKFVNIGSHQGECPGLTQLPTSFHKCTKLVHLSLAACVGLTSLHDSIGACPQMTHLTLRACRLLQKLPNHITQCTNLMYLDLSGCKGLEELPEGIGACNKLTELSVCDAEGLANLPQSMGQLTQLHTVFFRDCKGLMELPSTISGCSQLVNLHLGGCRKLQALPEALADCKSLRYLELGGCVLLEQLPSRIGGCSVLGRLDLVRCTSLKALPQSIDQCTRLGDLNVTECASLVALPDGIARCNKLSRLNLSKCTSLESVPAGLFMCTHLTHVVLYGCARLAKLPDIAALTQLAYLGLGGCESLVDLPRGIGACSSLTYLDLRECHGLKKLPDSICDCLKLSILNLVGCRGLEQLPDKLGLGPQKITVDVSECTALTQIPASIYRSRKVSLLGWDESKQQSLPQGLGIRRAAIQQEFQAGPSHSS